MAFAFQKPCSVLLCLSSSGRCVLVGSYSGTVLSLRLNPRSNQAVVPVVVKAARTSCTALPSLVASAWDNAATCSEFGALAALVATLWTTRLRRSRSQAAPQIQLTH